MIRASSLIHFSTAAFSLPHLHTLTPRSLHHSFRAMSTQQKAIVVRTAGGEWQITDIPKPTLTSPTDILVKIKAAALNPIDYKVTSGLFQGKQKGEPFDAPIVAGRDAAGIVEQVGSDVHHFAVGDEVYYAATVSRPGTFQQYQLVDARVVAKKPKKLSFEEAAALPLTTTTAYEAMKELMRVESGKSILITAGAGGVGSMASQLAKHWGLTVITTASRPETVAWTKKYGADHVVDHRKGIAVSFKEQQLANVDYCFNTFSDSLLPDIEPVLNPFGAVCGINGDISAKELPVLSKFMGKKISYHQQNSFVKANTGLRIETVGQLLTEVAQLVDEGKVRSTLYKTYSWHSVQQAFQLLTDRATVGKIVLTIDENAA